jgi:hypothetical protein
MNQNRQIWQVWAKSFHKWGVEEFVASILEAMGPVSVLGAQAVYFCQPFARKDFADSHMTALANLLEDNRETEDFITFLREGRPQ